MNGLPYYKRYPRDFIEGTLGMPFELKGAYSVILDLLYIHSGKLPDDSKYISGVLGTSVRKWNSLRKDLIEAGKLASSAGCLTNYRAFIEVESLRKFQDKQSENRTRPNKNNNLQSPRSHHTEPEPEEENKFSSLEEFSDAERRDAERFLARRMDREEGAFNVVALPKQLGD